MEMMKKEKWLERFAAKYVELGGTPEAAFIVAKRRLFNPTLAVTPEAAADEHVEMMKALCERNPP